MNLESLEPPVTFHLNAAIGWLELGNPSEAERELSKIPLELRTHPETLLVRWELAASRKEWERAADYARAAARVAPTRCDGWVKQAFALHELGRTREAWDVLVQVAAQFPDVSIIPYNLACYACRLQEREEALHWLQTAMKVGGRKEIMKMALQDPDLTDLRSEIQTL